MKTRILRAVVLVLAGFGTSLLLRPSSPSPVIAETPDTTPRYQLVAGRYTIALQTGDIAGYSVFRVDTRTGRTVYFATGMTKDGKGYGKWIPVDEQ